MRVILSLLLASVLYADILCQSAGSDVEDYAAQYANADSGEEREKAKEDLLDAVSDVFQFCDSRELKIIADLLEENKALKKENEKLKGK